MIRRSEKWGRRLLQWTETSRVPAFDVPRDILCLFCCCWCYCWFAILYNLAFIEGLFEKNPDFFIFLLLLKILLWGNTIILIKRKSKRGLRDHAVNKAQRNGLFSCVLLWNNRRQYLKEKIQSIKYRLSVSSAKTFICSDHETINNLARPSYVGVGVGGSTVVTAFHF